MQTLKKIFQKIKRFRTKIFMQKIKFKKIILINSKTKEPLLISELKQMTFYKGLFINKFFIYFDDPFEGCLI